VRKPEMLRRLQLARACDEIDEIFELAGEAACN